MSLVSLNEILVPARKEKYGVGAYDYVNLEMLQGILDAAEETKTPVILQFPHIEEEAFWAEIEAVTAMTLELAKKATVPVCVHLDHGRTVEACKKCADLGFTSVMIDGSSLPYEENLALTKEVVEYCKPLGVDVEAEIGHVGQGDDISSCAYTDVEEAKSFAAETGVDALAVSIGNAHGAYKAEPRINYEILSQIEDAISIPLVLHGGSGISDEDFKKIIKHGLAKINIFTELTEQTKLELDAIPKEELNMFNAVAAVRTGFKKRTLEKIELFETKPIQ